jgi:hypothetical protein
MLGEHPKVDTLNTEHCESLKSRNTDVHELIKNMKYPVSLLQKNPIPDGVCLLIR